MTTNLRKLSLSRRFRVTATAMLFSAALLTPSLTGVSTSAYAAGSLVAGGKAVISNTDGDNLRIRSGAGTENDQVAVGHEGEIVSILAGPQYDAKGERWFKVSGPGGTGWIVAGYLDAQGSDSSTSQAVSQAAPSSGGYTIGGKAVIANTDGDAINMRSGAGTENDQVATGQEGQAVTLLAGPQYDAKGERWFKVSGPGGTGWVVAGYLNPQAGGSSSSSKASSPGSGSTGGSGYVVGGKALIANTDGDTIRVRSGAGTENDQVAEAQEGQVVTIIAGPQYDTKGERWFKVNAPGGTGWIVAGYLDPQDAGSAVGSSSSAKSSGSNSQTSGSKAAASVPRLAGFGTVVNTDGDPLRVRTSPSADGDTVAELDPSASVAIKQGPVTDKQGIVWYQVSANGATGWSMGQYLAQSSGPATGSAASAPAPKPAAPAPTATPKPTAQPAARVQKPVQAAVAPTKAPVIKVQASTSQSSASTSSSGSASLAIAAPVRNLSSGNAIVNTALKYVGYRYVFGGTTPSGFDCSGFLYYVLNKIGISVGRSMDAEISSGPRVSSTNLQPGDLLFFSNTYKSGLSHAGIYIGNGKFVHAENESTGVAVSDLWSAYWGAHYTAAVRPSP